MRISTRNATFQQWEALLTNRNKRQRAGEFLVQGVRPISLAVERGWEIRTLLASDGPGLSKWGREVIETAGAPRAVVAAELMRELGGKDEDAPELLAVVGMPPDDLTRLTPGANLLVVVFDRPTTPGNIGTLGGRVRRHRRGRHRARRGPVRPEGGPGQHRVALRAAGGTGAEPPGGPRLGR